MSAPSSKRARQIFSEVSGRPLGEQEEVLRILCGDDAGLLAEVRALRGGSHSPSSDAESDGSQVTALPSDAARSERRDQETPWHAAVDEQPGARIGPYKLQQQIGEGGFGSVFMAEQESPVRRIVALKIIKLGMDTRQVVARFEQERQALALMDHPNIAKVFDAGSTVNGRPYFVMELCRGEPITTYCDKNSLTIADRLQLFVQVCHAVQHAHQKGLIHRDIKPSNILVSNQDGKPHVKVIDFGIAKATASKLTEMTLFTDHQQMIGTPNYMSPEQAEGSLDIDTRTDVYSLGVLLYELLTGVTPFDAKSLRAAAYAEIQRIIREVEPPKPSTRLSNNVNTMASVAASRHTEPRKLGSTLRGELDWIVMKALEKDRQRRYETANGLSMDVQRYLAGEVVVAAPPSRLYRVQKFVHRNRAGVVAASVVGLVLLLGLAGTAYGLRQALIARDGEAASKRAAEHEAERALNAEAQTRARADELKRVADFQAKMLSQIDATGSGVKLMEGIRQKVESAINKSELSQADRTLRIDAFVRDLTLASSTDVAADLIDQTILSPAVNVVNADFKDQPLVDSALRQTLADLYSRIGRYDKALSLQESALAIRRRELGDDDPQTLSSVWSMGKLLSAQGKWPEAHPFMLVAMEKRRRILGATDIYTLASINTMGILLQDEGKFADAEMLLREAMDTAKRQLGEDHPDTLNYIASVGLLLEMTGRRAEAEPFLREAMEKQRRVNGEDHPDAVKAVNNYGVLMLGMGRYPEAEKMLREAMAKKRRLEGDEHPSTLKSINNAASAMEHQGKIADAEVLYREVLEKSRRTLGDEHPDTLRAIANLANILRDQEKFAEAEPLAREAMNTFRRVQGMDQRETLIAINVYGYVLIGKGDPAAAEPYWRESYENGRRVLGEDHPDVLVWTNNLGGLLITLNRRDEAEPLLREALVKSRRVNGEDHPNTLFMMHAVAKLLQDQGKRAEAEALYRELFERRKQRFGMDVPETLMSAVELANCLRTSEKFHDAEAVLREALPGSVRVNGERDWKTGAMKMGLGRVLVMQGRCADAEPYLIQAEQVLATAAQPRTYESCLQVLATLYDTWNKSEPGHGYDEKASEWSAKLDAQRASTQPAATQPSATQPASPPPASTMPVG